VENKSIHLLERWSQISTFGKGGAKYPPLEKVEPNPIIFGFTFFLKGKVFGFTFF